LKKLRLLDVLWSLLAGRTWSSRRRDELGIGFQPSPEVRVAGFTSAARWLGRVSGFTGVARGALRRAILLKDMGVHM
jgi:hypothetical protein